jgi:hypothetical protein
MMAKVGNAVLLLTLAAGAVASAQNYNLDWSTIDGGGGTSTGGVFTVSGTIGQPDAGPTMKGGNYSLDGGFWSVIVVVPAPGTPSLTVTRTATNSVIISWPSPSTGWVLWQNTNVSTANWSEVLTTPSDDGNTKSVTVAPPVGTRFYRLKK